MDAETLQKICTIVGGKYSNEFIRGTVTTAEVSVCRIDNTELILDKRFGQLAIQSTNYLLSLPAEELVCKLPEKKGEPVICTTGSGKIKITSNGVLLTMGD